MQVDIIACLVVILAYGVESQQPFTSCSDGWLAYEGNCYLFGHQVVHFIEAEHYCRQHNSHLIELENSLENLFIKDRLRDQKSRCFWLGLSDEAIEGVWKWYTTNQPTNFTDWFHTEPHSTGPSSGDCALFWPDYDFQWGDLYCTYDCSPLCKAKGREEAPEIVGRR